MPRSVTLRLSDDVYQKFSQMAREENRSMANLVETLALQKLTEEIFTDTFEAEEILANSALMKKLKRGHMQVELRKGRFVE
jgi:predicted transcriptional regulator